MSHESSVSHSIVQATDDHVELITPLFDAYRQFYGEASDIELCEQFLTAQIGVGDTVIYLALEDEGASDAPQALGFTILYPTFNSVLATPMWVLNNIYIAENARRRGLRKP